MTGTGEVGGDWNRGRWWWLEQGMLVVAGTGEIGGDWNREIW